MKIGISSFVLFFVLYVNILSQSYLKDEKKFGPEYFPLNKNFNYKFESNFGKTTGKFNQNGKYFTINYLAEDGKLKYTLFKDSTGIYLTKTETDVDVFLGISSTSSITYDRPILRIPFPLMLGQTWKWEGYEIEDGERRKIKVEGKVLGEEDMNTPIGKFECLKIRIKFTSEEGANNTITEWLAPNVGAVKIYAKLESTGIAGFFQTLLGLDEIYFNITEFKKN
ncbi:MAG: DUF3108 domain-containing protein [Ignavibacteriales bacterium]|nr:DUF3108 domain-containing protein [Ignavibacteriales bacterium]